MPDSTDPAWVMAQTIWGESRGCGAAGMRHVASVIKNRADASRWWGHDIVSVCLAPFQFSCWLPQDPNSQKIKEVTEADKDFQIALGIARQAVAGTLIDETGHADSYYAASMKVPPAWAAKAVRTVTDGWHWFFRTELGPAPGDRDLPEKPPSVGQVGSVNNHSIHSAVSAADALNAAELEKDQSDE